METEGPRIIYAEAMAWLLRSAGQDLMMGAMVTAGDATPPQRLDGVIGKHLIYTYATGWQYELYVKNESTIDYRIHSGIVGGRWVKDQNVRLSQLTEGVFTCAWTEPTGTSVSLTLDLPERRLHGTIFFPRWVEQNPEKTICFQNEHLPEMRQYRDQGPSYPIAVIDEFARITFAEDLPADDDTVIDRPPDQLPAGYTSRTN